jgi:hypothetical protein
MSVHTSQLTHSSPLHLLQAAGIEMKDRQRRSRGINYGKEVPFEMRPAAGFYDVGEEGQATKEMREEFRPVTIEELEGKKRRVSGVSGVVWGGGPHRV